VTTAVWQAYEQWDGKGPRRLRGAEISLPARLVAVASTLEVIARRHGTESARKVARRPTPPV